MKSIILIFILMSTLILTGCSFSFIRGGFVYKKENQFLKIGSISNDILSENAINEFIEYEEKQKREEDWKDEGAVFGIFFVRKF